MAEPLIWWSNGGIVSGFGAETIIRNQEVHGLPTGVIGVVIQAHGHNDARAYIRAAPAFAAAGHEFAPNEKVTMGHAGRYEVAHARNSRAGRR